MHYVPLTLTLLHTQGFISFFFFLHVSVDLQPRQDANVNHCLKETDGVFTRVKKKKKHLLPLPKSVSFTCSLVGVCRYLKWLTVLITLCSSFSVKRANKGERFTCILCLNETFLALSKRKTNKCKSGLQINNPRIKSVVYVCVYLHLYVSVRLS